jgi:hypothetical protein
VRSIARALDGDEIAALVAGERSHPLAAVYRIEVLDRIETLLADGQLARDGTARLRQYIDWMPTPAAPRIAAKPEHPGGVCAGDRRARARDRGGGIRAAGGRTGPVTRPVRAATPAARSRRWRRGSARR